MANLVEIHNWNGVSRCAYCQQHKKLAKRQFDNKGPKDLYYPQIACKDCFQDYVNKVKFKGEVKAWPVKAKPGRNPYISNECIREQWKPKNRRYPCLI